MILPSGNRNMLEYNSVNSKGVTNTLAMTYCGL